MDFVNAEINPECRKPTFEHYLGNTPKLGSILEGWQRDRYEGRILLALEIAYQAHCDKRRLSWAALVAHTDEVEHSLTA